MQCPACQHSFKFKEVPLEERRLKMLYAEFLCPRCAELLKPSLSQIVLINLSILIFVAGLVALLLVDTDFAWGVVIMGVGATLFVLSKIFQRVERVET